MNDADKAQYNKPKEAPLQSEKPAKLPSDNEYPKVRSWYLARLRRAAIEKAASERLTPASLIAADKDLVEKLVLEKAAKPAVKKQQDNSGMITITWLLLMVGIAAWLFVLEGFDIGATITAFFKLSAGYLLGQSPQELFTAGLPQYFKALPLLLFGWPFVQFVIMPILSASDEDPDGSMPGKRNDLAVNK
jgi:hypothetical protein